MNPLAASPMPRAQMPNAIAAIAAAHRIVLACHVNPDGDALGSLLGLALGLIALGKEVVPLSSDGVPPSLTFLPGAELVRRDTDRRDFDLAIVVDSGDLTRIGNARSAIESAPVVMDVDHHVTGAPFGQIRLIDGDAAATAEIVFDMLTSLDVEVTIPVAENLLCGILTDTGSFRFRNTTPRTFQIASALTAIGASPNPIAEMVFENRPFAAQKILGRALDAMRATDGGRIVYGALTQADFAATGASDADTDGISSQFGAVRGAVVALFLRETKEGKWRVSLRSREPFDVSAVAAQFGGGGHRLASGCTMTGTLAQAEAALLAAVRGRLE